MALIKYLGKEQNSSIERKLTDEEFDSIRKEYYQKCDISEVTKQLKSIYNGGTTINKIYDYFLKDIMAKAVGPGASWSIEEGLNYKPIMEYFAGKVDVNEKIFPKTNSLCKNIETAFRLCGIRYCVKLPNYPMQSVDAILSKYNINNNYYDYSCGWAVRMLGAMHKNVNYFGTDPNYLLTERLNQIHDLYDKTNNISTNVNIYTQGSEEFMPELENKIGLAFSSPPYFDLEDYRIGNQSYKEGTSYESWLNNYLEPTIQNIYQYLIDDGLFIINIKNFNKNHIEEDAVEVAKKNGFYLYKIETLNNIKRCHGDVKTARNEKEVTLNDNSEKIYIFSKKENYILKTYSQTFELF